jgi:hypothetical protein
MLKFVYTETATHLERIDLSLSDWIDRYQSLCRAAGMVVTIDCDSRYSFPVSIDFIETSRHRLTLDRGTTVSIERCDAECVEVQIDGCWLASQGTEEGVFITELSHTAEDEIWHLWHAV